MDASCAGTYRPSRRAVEAAGDCSTLLLDKTGRHAREPADAEFIPLPGVAEIEPPDAAQLSSLADETPEGRSIVVLAKSYGLRERTVGARGRSSRSPRRRGSAAST